jgi:hypothetical protein
MTEREKMIEAIRGAIRENRNGDRTVKMSVEIAERVAEMLEPPEAVPPEHLVVTIMGKTRRLPICGICHASIDRTDRFCRNCGREVRRGV